MNANLTNTLKKRIRQETSHRDFRGWEFLVFAYLDEKGIKLSSDEIEKLYDDLQAFVRYQKMGRIHRQAAFYGEEADDSNDVQLEDGVWAGDSDSQGIEDGFRR